MLFTTRQRNIIFNAYIHIKNLSLYILLQYIGYEVVLKQEMKDLESKNGYPEGKTHYARWDIREEHPINIGRNLFGVASCMAFFKIIFQFEIHYKFGPILFCIKQVCQIFWRIYLHKLYYIQYTQISIPCRFVYRFFIF